MHHIMFLKLNAKYVICSNIAERSLKNVPSLKTPSLYSVTIRFMVEKETNWCGLMKNRLHEKRFRVVK